MCFSGEWILPAAMFWSEGKPVFRRVLLTKVGLLLRFGQYRKDTRLWLLGNTEAKMQGMAFQR